MENYKHALSLLEEAARIMIDLGDTLVAAHIATPIDVIETRLIALHGTQKH